MKVLIVEDEIDFGELLSRFLSDKGYTVKHATKGLEAIELIEKEQFDIILLDLFLPDVNGMELLRSIKGEGQLQEVIVITGHGTVKTAVEAMKLGSFDFLTKPCTLLEIETVIRNAQELINLKRENYLFKSERRLKGFQFIYKSQRMRDVVEKISKIACSDCNVMVLGESGVGKEFVARFIHELSNRKDKPFIAVNLPAIPEELMEAELFGYEKGAFTGASSARIGFFELAKGGTIFLDEITEMSISAQAKLLRVIENKRFYRVGGRKEIESDVRIICATNRDIKRLVEEGLFREDLYYRLNVVEIYVPPLRERHEDILPLAEHFLDHFKVKYNKDIKGFSREARDLLLSYHYPGNIRELKNIIERAVLFCDSDYIEPVDIDLPKTDRRHTLRDIERERIEEVLKSVGYNKRRASEILGIPLRTLYRKLEKYGLL